MFNYLDFDGMRKWLYSLKGSFEIRRARINIFDLYRYQEEYDKLYRFIEEMGGHIQYNNS